MARAEELFDRLVAGGQPAIAEFIAQGITEELFLDYKRSADNGAGRSLHNSDRANLAKAISGFGNSEGGVIVWGVDCRMDPARGADIPTGPVPIVDPTRFKSLLEQATSGLTVPPHSNVRHHVIPEGFVLSLIPSGAHAPYQALPEQSYYIRTGSNFARAPHAVLAGMFGRRPQSAIKHTYLISDKPDLVENGVRTQIGFRLHNFGRGIAENAFLNLKMKSHPGRGCEVEFLPSAEDAWWGRVGLGHEVQLVMRAGFVLPPEAYILPLSLDIVIGNPIEGDFAFDGLCGSSDGEPWRFEFSVPMARIIEAADPLLRLPDDAPEFDGLARRFNEIFFRDNPIV